MSMETIRYLPQARPLKLRPYFDTLKQKAMYQDSPEIPTAVACLAGIANISPEELLRLMTNDNTEEVLYRPVCHSHPTGKDFCYNCVIRAADTLAHYGYISAYGYGSHPVCRIPEPSVDHIHYYREEIIMNLQDGRFGVAHITTAPVGSPVRDGDAWVIINRLVQSTPNSGVAYPYVQYSTPQDPNNMHRLTIPDFLSSLGGFNVVWIKPTEIACLYEPTEILELFQ